VVYSTKTQQFSDSFHLSTSGDIIEVALVGKMTSRTVQALGEDITRAAETIRRHNGRPVVLVDASHLHFSDIDSSGRTEGRRLLIETPVEGWALYGKSHMGMLAEYVARAAGASNKLRYFSDRRRAEGWLRGELRPEQSRSSVGLVVGIVIAFIGIVGIIGWQIDNPYLTRILLNLRPINPVAAVGLIALGSAFLCYWQGALRPLRLLGIIGILLGIAALLPLNIDTLLYSDAMRAAGTHTQLADSAAICFILSGALGLLANRKGAWVQPTEYGLAILMGLIAAFNVYGQLYAHDFIYGISDTFVMSLSLGIAFLVASVGMIILVLLRRTSTALLRVSRSGWLIVIVFVFMQAATYGAWAQAKDRTANEAMHAFSTKTTDINDQVNTRLQAYINALHGFRGLFAASDDVSQADFSAYFSSLNLRQTYPGMRSIAFIAAVKTSDLAAFAAERQADTSIPNAPPFKLQKVTSEPLHFIGTYVAGTSTFNSPGTDVTSIPGRSVIYNNALRSSGYYGSGTITFAATATQPATQGFFIATPVHTAKSATPIGVVSTNFNYEDFFGAILKSVNNTGLFLSVTDNTTGKTIYTAGAKLTGTNVLSRRFSVSLARNQSWQIETQAPATYGVTIDQERLARTIVFFGQLFTLLLAGMFISQIRARGQALALADAATEDLRLERDNIAALHIKDEAMLAGIGEGLIVIDSSGKIEVVNPAASQLLGYDENELVGNSVFDTLEVRDEKGQTIPRAKRPFEVAIKQRRIVTASAVYMRKDGRQVPVKLTVAPIILRGALIGAIEVFGDITHEKQLEHMKDEFLSVASHELRTPMGAVRANLSMILEGDYGPVNKGLVEPLTDMKSSTIRLVELVNDLLSVARIEAGRMHFKLAELDLNTVTKSVVSTLAALGKEKGVKVSFIPDKDAPGVQGDSDKVKEVLTNLIGNSLKFTDKGTITVATQAHDDVVEVTVTDTGIGISAEDQTKLFGKFNQITSAQAGKPSGTGLGLYISRQMVRKMGGDMWIKQSVPGHGSTFAFTLPKARVSKAKKAKTAIDQEAKLHPDQV
jgi:PAS domain S-box-containing protein